MSLRVAVCIATHNRRADLTRTLEHVARLTPPADELLICADGCTDDTEAFLHTAYPYARVLTHATAQGSIPSRNDLAAACGSDIFVSLDDDSYPLDTDFIAQVQALFSEHRRLAVVSFAQRTDEFPDSLTASDFGPAQFVGTFANSAAAIRREAFVTLGGYPGFFSHAYEEPDFALRCVCAGWQVRAVPAPIVRHHYTSAQRSELRMHHRHARNECWSIVAHAPALLVVPLALFRAARQFAYSCRRGVGWVVREPLWWWQALRGLSVALSTREPLPLRRYLAWMRLLRRPLRDEAEWNELFGGTAP
jgi:GT2 family glycosyltransferase